jgi:hypothetical protein
VTASPRAVGRNDVANAGDTHWNTLHIDCSRVDSQVRQQLAIEIDDPRIRGTIRRIAVVEGLESASGQIVLSEQVQNSLDVVRAGTSNAAR